ncbi:hypothetical protein E4U28_006938 [Claviceps purpurea]|nr:hypothetical protein E4U28_006938 [Claviceps purpurea]
MLHVTGPIASNETNGFQQTHSSNNTKTQYTMLVHTLSAVLFAALVGAAPQHQPEARVRHFSPPAGPSSHHA